MGKDGGRRRFTPTAAFTGLEGNKTESAQAWITESNKNVPVKFNDTRSIRAEGLCISCPKSVGSRKAGKFKYAGILLFHPVDYAEMPGYNVKKRLYRLSNSHSDFGFYYMS